MKLSFPGILILILWLGLPVLSQDACPDAPEPRLVIGQQGNVTPGPPNNVRDMPSRDGELIGEIPGAGIFVVVDGPACDGEIYWWKVDYDGLVGWTAEGKNNAYWVEPIASTPMPTATATRTPTATATSTPTATATPLPVHLERINNTDVGVDLQDLEYSPDGTMIGIVRGTHTVVILDAETLDTIMRIDLSSKQSVGQWIHDIGWHPDNQQIAVPMADRFRVYSVPDGDILWEKEMPHYFLRHNLEGNEELYPQTVQSVQFTGDGEQLLTLGDDGILRVWDYGANEPASVINARELELQNRQRGLADVGNMALSSDSTEVAFSFFEHDVFHWSLRLNGPIASLPPYDYGEQGLSQIRVAYSPDDRYIYYYARTPLLYIWDTESRDITVYEFPDGWVDYVAFHPDSDWVAISVRRSGEVPWLIIKDVDTGVIRSEYQFDASIRPFDFSPDGQFLATGTFDGNISIWKISE